MSNRRKGNNTDSRRYYDWLDRAEEDIIAANVLLQDTSCYNSSAFHSQQGIEKALKAYILLRSKRLVDGHNLTWLCKQALRYDKDFAKWLDESAELNRFYIETRYPSDIPIELEYREIDRYYNMAKEMYLFICEQVDDVILDD